MDFQQPAFSPMAWDYEISSSFYVEKVWWWWCVFIDDDDDDDDDDDVVVVVVVVIMTDHGGGWWRCFCRSENCFIVEVARLRMPVKNFGKP